MAEEKMTLEDWLDNLCVRFMINVPPEELASVERIFFQIEEAQWFYEDFIRPNDRDLPALNLRAFAFRVFQHCPLTAKYSDTEQLTTMFEEFMSYKKRVPVRGVIMLNEEMDKVVLVKGWKSQSSWSFPRGKINQNEDDLDCAIREVYEETGLNIREAGFVTDDEEVPYIDRDDEEPGRAKSVQSIRLYIVKGVPLSTQFLATTRKEISKIDWFNLADLYTSRNKHRSSVVSLASSPGGNPHNHKFYMVGPFLRDLRRWISKEKQKQSSHPPRHLSVGDGYTSGTTDGEFPAFSRGTPKPSPGPLQTDPLAEFKRVLNISPSTESPGGSRFQHHNSLNTPVPSPSQVNPTPRYHPHQHQRHQHNPPQRRQQHQRHEQQVTHNLSMMLSSTNVPKSTPQPAKSTSQAQPSARPARPDGKVLLDFIQKGGSSAGGKSN